MISGLGIVNSEQAQGLTLERMIKMMMMMMIKYYWFRVISLLYFFFTASRLSVLTHSETTRIVSVETEYFLRKLLTDHPSHFVRFTSDVSV